MDLYPVVTITLIKVNVIKLFCNLLDSTKNYKAISVRNHRAGFARLN